jgi:hypothetical protein
MYTLTFFIEGKFHGTAPYTPKFSPDRVPALNSHLYYCTVCGEVYARIHLNSTGGKLFPFQSIAGVCKRCPSHYLFRCPGSVWVEWLPAFNLTFPKEVLQLELLHHLNQLEKLNECN